MFGIIGIIGILHIKHSLHVRVCHAAMAEQFSASDVCSDG